MSTSQPKTSTILYIGASRGIGYAAYESLAKSRPDKHHILLLRSISSFKSRLEYKSLSDDILERTTFVEGDAFNEEDVKRAVSMNGVEAVVYTVGEYRC